MGDRAIRWLVGGLGLPVGIAAELVQRGHAIPAERLLVDFLVGQAYLMGGLFAWSREPRNRTWKLMAGVGIAWYLGSFAVSSVPIVRDLAVVLADADAILLVALVLAYPTGRLERPSERLVVFGGAVGLTLGNVMLLLVHDSTVALVIGLAVTLAMAILVPRRWLLATPRHRRLLAPTLVATAITLLAIGAAIVVRLADLPPSVARFVLAGRDIALLAIPLSFVVGFFQQAAERYQALLAAIPDRSRGTTRTDGHCHSRPGIPTRRGKDLRAACSRGSLQTSRCVCSGLPAMRSRADGCKRWTTRRSTVTARRVSWRRGSSPAATKTSS